MVENILEKEDNGKHRQTEGWQASAVFRREVHEEKESDDDNNRIVGVVAAKAPKNPKGQWRHQES